MTAPGRPISSTGHPTVGTLPIPSGGGVVYWASIPDFVPLNSQGHVAGHVKKTDMFQPPGPGPVPMPNVPKPVYVPDLRTIVGYDYPYPHGYVPLQAGPSN